MAEVIPFDIKARQQEYRKFVRELAKPPETKLTGFDVLCGIALMGFVGCLYGLLRR